MAMRSALHHPRVFGRHRCCTPSYSLSGTIHFRHPFPSQVFQEEAPDAFPLLHQTQQRWHDRIAEEGDEEEGEEDEEDVETPEFR